MPEFVFNPRRSPRAPIRCATQVITARGTVDATTEDVGMRGVQVVSPRQLHKGEPIRLILEHPTVKRALELAGHVSWATPHAPWRAGVAFDEQGLGAARRWYEQLVEANPGLPTLDRVPDRIALDASVFLGAPPRWVVDFTVDEALVLRAIGSGATLEDLKVKLRDRWGACQRAVFSLLARHHVTLQRGQGVHPDAWKRILADLEAEAALGEIAPPTPTPAPVAIRPAPPVAAPVAAPAPVPAPAPAAKGRSPDAEECLQRGLAELGKGNIASGVALLRRAAQLSPGDEEILTTLWKASSTAASSRRA
ncbi:MAG: PilZ domain-containing protein [Anaeromyxobacteraceae bacterium]